MIDTKAIRTKVLDLAIRGKLTEQKPEDGTAEELYQQIQAEKEALIQAGRIKREKSLPEIKADEVPFEVPKGWKWVYLGTCGTLKGGYAFRSNEYTKDGIQVVRISDLSENCVDCRDAVYYPPDNSLSMYMIKMNSFLICLTGSIGKMAWVKDDKPRYLNQRVGMFEPSLCCETEYLWWYLHSDWVLRQWMWAKRSTNGNIRNTDVTELLLPLPPLAEQHRIVAKIDAIFSLLDTIDALQSAYTANQKALRAKLIDAAIRGQLTEQLPEDGTAEELYQQIQAEKQALIAAGKIKREKPLAPVTEDEKLFEVPGNWMWVRLGDLSKKITSGNTPQGGKKSDAYVENGYCFFREQNIYDDGIHEEGMVFITEQLLNTRSNSTVFPKDLLLNITGGSIGRCAIVPDDFSKGSINQHILIIRMLEETMRYFVHTILRSPYAQKYIKSKAVGDKDGFSGGRCKLLPVPLPPLAEQRRIVARLEELLAVCGG